MEDHGRRTGVPGDPMWGMPTGSLVKEQGPKFNTAQFMTFIPKVEIVSFGDPVAGPGPFSFPDHKTGPTKTAEFDQDSVTRPVLTGFEQSLRRLINAQCVENLSNTPDFILAEYLSGCLNAFNYAVQRREQWYGRKVF